jgi:lipopolysaccharide export system ATP-binding protein
MSRLVAENLERSYRGRRVVAGISLDVAEGEVVGLLGPNGAGKTTTFGILAGSVRPDAGRVLLEGEDVTGLPMHLRARCGLGYLPQESSVFRYLSVEENLTAVLEFRDLTDGERRERVEVLLREMGLEALRGAPAHVLSGGERRRLEIGRALASEPRVLLLDEPFAGIDPVKVGEIQSIVRRLAAQGIGIIVTDHNVRETLEVTDRAYIIHEGRILVAGDAPTLLADPEVRRHYLGEKFRM